MSGVLIILSALAWSYFPIYGHQASGGVFFSYLLYSQIFSAACCLIGAKQPLKTVRRGFQKAPVLTVCMSGVPVLHQCLFVMACTYISTPSATLIFETWPIFVLLVAPFVLGRGKAWINPTIALVAFPLATLGLLATMAGTGENLGYDALLSPNGAFGVLCAISASFVAAFAILKVKFAETIIEDDASVRSAITANFVCRVVPIAPLIIVGLLADLITWERDVIISGAITGVFVHSVSATLGDYGVRLARSAAPLLLFYYSPLLGMFWLVLFYDISIPAISLIGAALIIVANVYSNIRLRRVSLLLTLIVAIAYMSIAYYSEYHIADTLSVMSVLGLFFSVIAGGTLQRTYARALDGTRLLVDQLGKGRSLAAVLRGWSGPISKKMERKTFRKVIYGSFYTARESFLIF